MTPSRTGDKIEQSAERVLSPRPSHFGISAIRVPTTHCGDRLVVGRRAGVQIEKCKMHDASFLLSAALTLTLSRKARGPS